MNTANTSAFEHELQALIWDSEDLLELGSTVLAALPWWRWKRRLEIRQSQIEIEWMQQYLLLMLEEM